MVSNRQFITYRSHCAVLVFSALALSACGGGGSGSEPEVKALAGWEGEWTSYATFLPAPEMQTAYQAMQQHAPGFTLKGIQSGMDRMLQANYQAVKVEGSTIHFLDNQGKVLSTVVYEAKGKQPMGFGDAQWALFEAKPDKSKPDTDLVNTCRYFIASAVGRDTPDGIKHWHTRCGAESFDATIKNGTSWPTLVEKTTTAAMIAQDIKSEAKGMAAMLGAPLQGWYGKWISVAALLKDPVMQPSFEKIAQEALKLGKSYTAQSVKTYFQGRYQTNFDFIQVSANGVSYEQADGTVTQSCQYLNDGLAETKRGWTGWISQGSCPGMSRVVAVDVDDDGEGNHWHFRFSDAPDALETLPQRKDWIPTGFDPVRMTPAAYAKLYADNAQKYASRLP